MLRIAFAKRRTRLSVSFVLIVLYIKSNEHHRTACSVHHRTACSVVFIGFDVENDKDKATVRAVVTGQPLKDA